MIETTKYSRRPFDVEAVRVTKSNMEDIAEWCGGEVVIPDDAATGPDATAKYIQVDVHAPANERQSRAFPGDYVLLLEGGRSFKVYTTKAFNKNFVKSADQDTPVASSTPAPARAKKEPASPPANGIKPEAREALQRMSSSAQAAVAKGKEKAKDISKAMTDAVESAKTDQDEAPVEETIPDVTPTAAAPVEVSPEPTPVAPVEAGTADASAQDSPELQVVHEPVGNTTKPELEVTDKHVHEVGTNGGLHDEPVKPEGGPKRKFIQQG